MNMKSKVLVLAGALAALASTYSAQAAEWPQKPITLILGWAPGGGADITSRAVFHPFVEDLLGQKIVIQNKAGAGGEISFVALANTRPDGYTFGWTVTPNLVSFPISHETQYALEDLKPVANITYDPGVLVVPKDSQFQSVKDLVDYAKAHPGEIDIGNGGTGGDDFIAVELLKLACDCDITQVPYAEGTGAQISALLGKHIDASAINASEALAYDNVRILGVMADERSEIIPDTKSFQEQGFDVISGSARGFSAPAGTPPEIVQKMADAVEKVMGSPEFKERAEKQNLITRYMGPDEYQKMLARTRNDLKKVYEKAPW